MNNIKSVARSQDNRLGKAFWNEQTEHGFHDKAFTESGLGLGMTMVNVLFLTVIVGLIAYLSIMRKRAVLLSGEVVKHP